MDSLPALILIIALGHALFGGILDALYARLNERRWRNTP